MTNILAKTFGTVGKSLALLIVVPLVAVFLWLPWLIIALLPVPIRLKSRWIWALRSGFWNLWATLKFQGNKPVDITVPGRMTWWRWVLVYFFGKSLKNIKRVPFETIFPSIRISNIKVAGHEPADEWDWKMKLGTWLQVKLYTLFPPMQEGLDSIDPDPYEALRAAYTKRHRKLFDPPVMPLEFQGSPDLGALAVKGPYACYLRKYERSKESDEYNNTWDMQEFEKCADWLYEWDFRDLNQYEHHDGLYKLGVRVLFLADKIAGTVKPIRIKSELGLSIPSDATWEFAKKLALCAATNHLSLVRHFNGVHLASSAHVAIATRNWLFPDHCLCRLLWPHTFRTQQSNRAVTIAQMVKGGDFDSIFSFTHQGMCDLFSGTFGQYKFIVNDPEKDAQDRGIDKGGFATPTQNDAQELFKLFRQHARDYIEIYYKSNAAIQKDGDIERWLEELNATIPNGIGGVLNGPITRDSVANLIGCFIYLATVQHDIVGSFLWNYQLWAHKQPTRLYRDGRRLPLDVYQRLVNANYNLNVFRTALMLDEKEPPFRKDFSYLALPDKSGAANVLKKFQTELKDFEAKWRMEPWHVWRVYPKLLEANINA